ncbi:MAG: YdbH domain-containing protein [Cognaticolwellia sp.]
MISPKKSLIVLATITITIIFLYLARVAIVKSVIKEELALYETKITCLDFNLTKAFDLAITHLCLQTPQANINIDNITITLQIATEQKIKRIDVASVNIDGTAELLTKFNSPPQESNSQTLTAQLQLYVTQLAQVSLPFDINVKKIRYSPYLNELQQVADNNRSHEAKKTTQVNKSILPTESAYYGHFLAVDNIIEFSLKNQKQATLFSARLLTDIAVEQEQFSLELTGQLPSLHRFILAHQLPLSTTVSNALTAIAPGGDFRSTFNYQAGLLTVNSQMIDLALTSSSGIEQSGPFELKGNIDIHGQLNLNKNGSSQAALVQINSANKTLDKEKPVMAKSNQLELLFEESNTLQLEFSHSHAMDFLSKQALSPELVTLLKDNPVTQLAINPAGKLVYNLSTKQLSLSHIEVTAKSSKQTHQLNLDNIALSVGEYLEQATTSNETANKTVEMAIDKNSPLLAQLDFTIDSPINLSAVNSFTAKPILINLKGSISHNQAQTTITFDENSFFMSNNLVFTHKEKTSNKKLLSIKQLKTQVQGNLEIQHPIAVQNHHYINNTKSSDNISMKANQPSIQKQSVNLQLKIDSEAENLRAANIIDIKTLALKTTITGNLNDIAVNTLISADTVPLGNLTIKGAVEKPSIELNSHMLSLTDLLSLNIKLPMDIALVDGALNYNIKGQVDDITSVQDTPLAITVAVSSLSGEIDGIWIQELNFTQNFNYLAGKLTTQDEPKKNDVENDLTEIKGIQDKAKPNLTVALIDTPTPISKLSISTAWSYQKDFKVSATDLSGDILGGSFSIPKVQWPLDHDHSVDVQLTRIDLEQVLALDKKQGIVVTGSISGQLPIGFDGEKYTMEQGELHNVGDGLIQVMNNPAVEELKANNSQLQLAFDALQNLHYHQLSSDVSMADDGYMLLETVIKGRNPDIDNDVNLNLNLSYDLLGLLESMSITERFEKSIIKGLQKH